MLALTGCGAAVNNTLTSPGYPDEYPSNLDCRTSVSIPQGMQMKIHFIEFDLEDNRNCR